GRCLVVAAAEPLSDEVTREVRSKLGCELSVRIVPQLRLAAALAHHYGLDLDARSRRLADALRKREPGASAYGRPPSDPLRPSMRPPAARPLPTAPAHAARHEGEPSEVGEAAASRREQRHGGAAAAHHRQRGPSAVPLRAPAPSAVVLLATGAGDE